MGCAYSLRVHGTSGVQELPGEPGAGRGQQEQPGGILLQGIWYGDQRELAGN